MSCYLERFRNCDSMREVMKIELSLKGFSIEFKNTSPRLVIRCSNNRGGKTRRVSSVGLRSEEGLRNGKKLLRELLAPRQEAATNV